MIMSIMSRILSLMIFLIILSLPLSIGKGHRFQYTGGYTPGYLVPQGVLSRKSQGDSGSPWFFAHRDILVKFHYTLVGKIGLPIEYLIPRLSDLLGFEIDLSDHSFSDG